MERSSPSRTSSLRGTQCNCRRVEGWAHWRKSLLGTAVLSAGGRDTGGVQGAAIPRGLTVVMAIAGIGIVVFATIAAMGG